MSESIDFKLKRAAIVLAEESSYSLAAEKLEMSVTELRDQISLLETKLCFHLFAPRQKKVEPTEEGQFLIEVFRQALALHDRNDRTFEREAP